MSHMDRFGRPGAAAIAFSSRVTDYSVLSVFPARW
jgi:hypothetical protein